MDYDLQKFINAVLFFAYREVKHFGITKLNKLLYYSDFEHYRLYGRPILGDHYIRMEHGPVPETSYAIFNANFLDGQDTSLKDVFEVRSTHYFSFNEKTIVPKGKLDLSVFSQSELEVMGRVADQWKDASAREIRDKSHLEKTWQETAELGVIDYKFALEQPGSISREYAEYREQEDKALESLLAGTR